VSPLVLSVLFAAGRTVTINDAIATARAHQPALLQARANTEVSRALADVARAPLLPSLTGSAVYTRKTGNFAPAPGALPNGGGLGAGMSSFNTYNTWSFGLSFNQFIFDFNQTLDHWRSTLATADATAATEANTAVVIAYNVRNAFFNARATQALVRVAEETLANQKLHLDQTTKFVRSGIQPELALAQANTNYANARVQLISAENNFLIAKAQLNLAMGVEQSTDYEVADETLDNVDGEEDDVEPLAQEAKRTRGDLVSLVQQVRAQELQVRSAWEGLAPALSVSMSLNDAGTDLGDLVWNWNAQFALSAPIISPGIWATLRQQRGLLVAARAQVDLQRQQVRLDVEQAVLAVRAAKESITATTEALGNAKQQLRLAEGRYKAGLGNMIELSDSQVAYTTAQGNKVQADYNLAVARAQLMKALGRRD
jgi:outer membrane protein